MSYWYGTETNKYGRDLDPTKVSTYIRSGYLAEIDYGTRTSAEFGSAPARVLFTVADRCLPNTTCDSAHPANWPDVPWDQSCTASTCLQSGPSFWTAKRLSTVSTQVWGGTAYRDVEKWTLTHTYPDPGDGTRAGLWLSAISHTGLVGGTASVPDVTFTGVQMPNRVDTIDGSPAMNWWRIASIRNDAGGEVSVGYSAPDCVAGSRMPASPETNTLRCYPVLWTPQGATGQITDWFHKYVVNTVSETDHTGGAPRVLTSYTYIGSPAWHYTDDDGLTPASSRTWSVWRGYERVGTTKGDPGEQSYGEIQYFRGMNGDHLPSGTRTASLTDTRGGTFTDSDVFAGQARERITFAGPGGAEVSDILTDPWQSAPTASRTVNGVTTQARFLNSTVDDQRIALDGGRGFMETKTVTEYDQYGAVTRKTDYGDVSNPNDDQCTQYTYARNTTAWLMSYTSRVQTYALRCDQTPTSADQIIGDAKTSFDGQAWGTAPTKGDVTQVDTLSAWSNGAPTYITMTRSQYDANGRVTDTWDVDNNHTTTAYTPPTGGPVTRTTVTNPLGWVTTTEREPAWGLTTGITDPNGRRTDVTYDSLGRTTAVWLPGRAKGVRSANMTYAYLIRSDGPSAITTQTLNPNGGYITTYQLFDSLLRPRQTQATAVGAAGGRILTDTLYDTAGRAYKQNAAYVADGTPGTTLFVPSGDNQIADQTVTLFDGADRPTVSILRAFGVEQWRSSTVYGGDHTDVTPPPGGVAASTIIDARGRTTALREYHGATLTGPYDTTQYTFNAKNLPATITDPVGNVWSFAYDVQGRPITATDPDKGTSTKTYDAGGRVRTTTDGLGRTLAYTYDALGRMTAEYDGSTTGPKLSETTYDTLAKGQVTSSTRWVGANAYTTTVLGYDPMYRPTGKKVTIPAVEGALAGTYQFTSTYKPDGSPATLIMPPAGGLAQEVLTYNYTDLGQPTTLGGANTYVTQADYTRLGEPAVLTLSTGGPIAQVGYYYDETTRRPTRFLDVRQTAPSTVADLNLSYDAAGNVTKLADTPTGGTPDTQCFDYDGKRRLTEAWTPSSGDCTAAPSTAALGGPAPYWQSFTYDAVGDRSSLVEHAASGNATTTYAYPAAATPQPHTVTSTTTVDSSGSRTVNYGYDAAGHTLTRPSGSGTQTFTWDAEGHIATVNDTGGGGTSSFIYDTSGTRLIRHDATGATLYLPGMELRANPVGQTSCTRYYSFGGTTVAQRTSAGVTWLMSDQQGTTQVAIAAAGSQAVSQRRQKPFGEPRGSAPAWPNQQGFVNGTNDPDGLVHLGARDYDPETGRFLSGDPVLDTSNPQAMTGYSYAGNTPLTASDPSGLMYMVSGSGGGGGSSSAPPPTPPPSPKPAPTKPAPPPHCEWWDVGCKAKQAFTTAVNWVGDHKAEVVGFAVGAVVGIGCGVAIGWTGVGAVACGALAGAAGSAATYLMQTQVEHTSEFSWGGLALNVGIGAVTGAIGGALGSMAGAAIKAGAGTLFSQGIKAGLSSAAKAAGQEGMDILAGKVTGGLLSNAAKSVADSAAGDAVNTAKSCLINSFVAGTLVTLANGTARAIEDIHPGNLVLTADPKSGKVQPHAVTATINGLGAKQLVDIDVADHGHLTATEGHPFWVQSRNAWVEAGKLQVGDQVVTPTGALLAVVSVRDFTAYQRVYNLSVDEVHTYFVATTGAPVLVHNCGPEGLIDLDAASASGTRADRNFFTQAGRALQKHLNRVGTGSRWPPVSPQTAGQYNAIGQDMLDEILTNPNSVANLDFGRINGVFQDTLDVFLPDGRGARFDLNGIFSGFLD
jgi:RHS repeat-associated protein